MANIFKKFENWWYFHMANPVVRRGEHGGFKWCFRRFWLEIETVSGNLKMRFTAGEHPFAYLLAGEDDSNIYGFCQLIYQTGMLLTTDQKFANDIAKAFKQYNARLEKAAKVEEDETEEEAALEFEKRVQEHVELPPKVRRKEEKRINKEFKKASKKLPEE